MRGIKRLFSRVCAALGFPRRDMHSLHPKDGQLPALTACLLGSHLNSLCCMCPHRWSLVEQQRFIHILYLCDWRNAIEHGAQITRIKYNILYLCDLRNVCHLVATRLSSNLDETFFDDDYRNVKYEKGSLTDEQLASATHVLNYLGKPDHLPLYTMVHSTWPMFSSRGEWANEPLDLVKLAKEYNAGPRRDK